MFLKKEFELYQNLFGKYKLNIESLKRVSGGKALEVGDVFAIYGDILVYGFVIEKNGDLAECVVLSPDVFLSSSKALKIKVNHLVDCVYVTHVYFYVNDNFAKNYCQVILNVKEDINKIAENVENLDEQIYTGARKEYFDFLIQQLRKLY
jgi:DNA-binding sugar fermentation-stimulating protein